MRITPKPSIAVIAVAVYAALMAVELTLIVRTVRGGVAGVMPGHFGDPSHPDGPDAHGKSDSDTLAFAY